MAAIINKMASNYLELFSTNLVHYNHKKTGVFFRLERLGGRPKRPHKILAVDKISVVGRAIPATVCTLVEWHVNSKNVKLFFQKNFPCRFIMLIYALMCDNLCKILASCYNSENNHSRVLIFCMHSPFVVKND